jgi:outer membrane protein assembly factor BamA
MLIFTSIGAQESIIQEIKILGAKKLKISFISKLITSKKGNVLDLNVLENDILKLKRLPPVANAAFVVSEANNNQVTVVFSIEENFTLIPFANLYSSTNEEFAF